MYARTHMHAHPHSLWRTEEQGRLSWVCSGLGPDLPPASFYSQGTKVCQESGACPGLLPQEAGLGPVFPAPFCTEVECSPFCKEPSVSGVHGGRAWASCWDGLKCLWSGLSAEAQQVKRSSACHSLAQPPCGPDGGLSCSEPPAHALLLPRAGPQGRVQGLLG